MSNNPAFKAQLLAQGRRNAQAQDAALAPARNAAQTQLSRSAAYQAALAEKTATPPTADTPAQQGSGAAHSGGSFAPQGVSASGHAASSGKFAAPALYAPAQEMPSAMSPSGTDDFLTTYLAGTQQNADRANFDTPGRELPLPRVTRTVDAAAKLAGEGFANAAGTLLDLTQRHNIGAMYTSTEDWMKAVERAKTEPSWAAVDALHDKADELHELGAERVEEAKAGLGKTGQTLVDVGVAGTQMLGDAALNALVPGAGLAAMGVRAFGSAAADARRRGADVARQAGYGAAVAAVEVISEKFFDGLAGIYGKGAADEIVESTIRKMTQSPGGQRALRLLASGAGEAFEEVISGAIDPALEAIINGKTGYSKDTVADVAHDALVGGILGFLGGAGQITKDVSGPATEVEITHAAQNGEKSAFNAAGTRARTQEGNIPTGNEAAAQAAQTAQRTQAQLAAAQSGAAGLAPDITQPAVEKSNKFDNADSHPYTENNGGVPNGGIEAARAELDGASGEGVQRPGEPPYRGGAESRGALGQGDVSDAGILRLSDQSRDALTKRGIEATDLTRAVDAAAFSAFLDEARKEDAANGWAVTPQSAESLAGKKLFLSEDGGVGAAIAPDGDIEAVFRNGKRHPQKRAMQSALPIIIEQGGRKLDCYGDALARVYAAYGGLVPVARLEFDPDFANDGWSPEKGTPYIYFMMATDTGADTIVSKQETYHIPTDAELAALPTFGRTEYDEAYAYRDSLLAGQKTTQSDGNSGGLPKGTGAASQGFTTPTSGEQVQTQNRVVTDSTYMTDEEKAALAPGTHERESREMRTERAAGQFYNDPEGNVVHLDETVQGLLEKEIWNSADQEAAIAAQEMLINQARLAETPEARAEAWKRVRELAKAIERLGGTEVGRSLRARQDWIASSERIVSDAAMILQDARRGTDDAEILNWISEEAASWQRASDERDVDAMRRIIERTSKHRRTGKLFSNELGKGISWALDRVCEQAKAQLAGGIAPEDSEAFSFLRQHAASGLTAVAYDQTPVRPGQALKTIRTNAMLSKISTIMRNLVSNNVFDPMDSVSRNISVPLDMAISKITGTRSVAADRGWLSGEKRQGSLDGLARSMLEVGLDVDATGERSRWETGGRRTFRMDAGPVQRALSSWEKWMGYMLNSTDQFQKGGIEAEVQRGLDELYRKGLITDPSLEHGGATEALYRTFQDETALSKLSVGARRALNALHIGEVGLGDIALPFAQVPANLASRAAEYSPVGIAKGVVQMAQVLYAAHKGTLTASQQAQAVQSIGRGINGTALIAAAVALALKGVLKVHDNGRDGEDKDKRALEKASGLGGTQLNLSALLRWANGESPEWRQGDLLHSIGFLDPLNAMLTTGSLIADDIRGGWDELKPQDIPLDALEGTLQSVLDMPVMNTFKEMAENYRYSQADTEGGRLLDAAKSFAAGQVSSVIPNSIKGVAQTLDPFQRDAYSSQDPFVQAWDSVRMSIPGLRQTLPEKLDSYGEPLRQQDALIRALNANVLPGAFQLIDIPQQAVTEELHSVYRETGEAGVYPDRKAPGSVTSGGEKYELTAEEKRQYQQTEGDAFLAAMQRLMASPFYDKWSAEEKADAITDAAAYGRALARQALIEGRGGSYEISGEARTFEKALTAAYAGVEIGRYYEIKAEHDRIDGTEGLSAQQKATRFALYLSSQPLTGTQKETLQGLLTYSGGFTAQASDKAIVANDLGIEPDVYEGYRSEISAMHDVKDEDGKTTTSRKEQVVAYIDGLDLTPEQKDYLFQTEYAKGIEETPWHQAKPASGAWWLG